MREELEKVFELLNGIQTSGYGNIKRLAMAMDSIAGIEAKIDSGELVVRKREEAKNGTEGSRTAD